MKLRDYQDEGADFLYAHDEALILAAVGSGKTAMALTAMSDMLKNNVVKKWLVIAPKRVAKYVWPSEVEIWAPELSLSVAVGTPAQRRKALESGSDIVVTNYDSLLSMDNLSQFDGVVFDELTRFKNPGGKRFKKFETLAKHIKIRWGLTGSFTSNTLEDVFGQCKVVSKNILGRFKTHFLEEFFVCVNMDYNEWAPQHKALERIMEKVKPYAYVLDSGVKSQYDTRIHPVYIDMPDDTRVQYEKMKNECSIEYDGCEKITAVSSGALAQKLLQMSSGFMYHTKVVPNGTPIPDFDRNGIWFSGFKFDALDEIIEENQQANCMIVYKYEEHLEELKRRYPKGMSVKDKGAIDLWNAGKLPQLFLQPQSAQHGLNLQFGGKFMYFLTPSSVPEEWEQVIGRFSGANRQIQDVDVYVLLTKNTYDVRAFKNLEDKQSVSKLVMEELGK